MNANNERCLGENSYKRNSDWDRKRRIVVNVEEPQKHIDFSDGVWTPYENLPIAPGLPDIVQDVDVGASHELGGGYHKRDTCANVRKYDGKRGEVSVDLSKIREITVELEMNPDILKLYTDIMQDLSNRPKIGEEVELEDDGLDGIETYFPDFESFNAYFPDFTAFNYKAETFNENDWPDFDVIE